MFHRDVSRCCAALRGTIVARDQKVLSTPASTLVSGLLDRLVYLSTGLSLIPAFIGVKLMLHYLHLQNDSVPEISTGTSLVVIGLVLIITTIASLGKVRRDPAARAHAGSLRKNPLSEEERSSG